MTTAMIEGQIPPPPLAGGGWGEGSFVRDAQPRNPARTPPPPLPLPQGEGEESRHALLRLLTWLSPAFPTGGFAYSHGLEWAVESADVTNPARLKDWLTDLLPLGAARSDAILLRHAHRVAADPAALAKLNDLATATAPSRERRLETLDQGTAFAAAAAAWPPSPTLPERVCYPVAIGAAAGLHRIPEDSATLAFLHAFTANLISAAVRLVPLGQTAGLRVLAAMEPHILRVAHLTRAATLDDIGGCVFRADMAAMRHETQYTRLFRS
jgi:urease accessory protein